jgi:hypothetical protein
MPLVAAPRPTETKGGEGGTNFEIKGQIVDNDPPDPVRKHPAKIHVVKLPAGKTVQIDLVSTEFDAYLRLEDSAGKQLAQDDDSGGNLNARIKFAVPKDDTYKIIATTFGGGSGNYTLSVKEVGGAAKANVAAAKLNAPTAAKATEIAGQLDANDPMDPIFNNSPAKFYEVELSEGTLYQIDLTSTDFDAYLRIFDKNGTQLAFDDDSGGDLNARLFFLPPAKATYRISATSLGGKTGAFNFSIAHKAKASKVDPTKVLEVGKDGLAVGGELTAKDAKDRVQANSACHVHQVKLAANKTYVIDMISGNLDSFLRVEDSGNNEIASDDDSGGSLNARISLQPTADGTYRIITTCLQGTGRQPTGPYVLMIREQ